MSLADQAAIVALVILTLVGAFSKGFLAGREYERKLRNKELRP